MNEPQKIYGSVDKRKFLSTINQTIEFMKSLRISNSETVKVSRRGPDGTILTVVAPTGTGSGGSDSVYS